MTTGNLIISFENPERPVLQGRKPRAELTPVSTGYFRSIQVPLLEGREFTDGDDMSSSQVMIVSQAFAQNYFPGEDALGKKLKPNADNGTPGGPPWREIIGVVGNVLHSATQREMLPTIYLPTTQLPNWCCLYTVVRTSLDPMSLEPAVRHLSPSLDAVIPVQQGRPLRDCLLLRLLHPPSSL